MRMKQRAFILEGHVPTVLRKLTLPMIFGIWSIAAFNIADTYFVSYLGTVQMAALTFTFPVVLMVNSINLGLGLGASAVISRVVGQDDKIGVRQMSTSALALSLSVAIVLAVVGSLTIDPLFGALGAVEEMPYIKQYMRIWYFAVPLTVIQMVGNNIIRALGDTKTPGIIMSTASIVNIILDPIFILGLGFVPQFSVAGAAIATVLARLVGLIIELYVLLYREKVICINHMTINVLLASWKKILYVGVPNALSRMVMPIGVGIITGLMANYGTQVVAGYGVATRVEFFSLSILFALSSVMPIYVGQNYGAKKLDRIRIGLKYSSIFSMVIGFSIYGLLFFIAQPIAKLFSEEAQVIDTVVLYLRIVPLGYAFQGILLNCTAALNALHHPLQGAGFTAAQMFLVYVPLALVLSPFLGLYGIFGSLVVSFLVAGIASERFFIHVIMKLGDGS